MKITVIQNAKKIILKTIIRLNESSEKFDRTQRQIEAVRTEVLMKHPEMFIRRSLL